MSRLRIVLLILLVLATFGVAQAQFINPPELLIYNAWVRPTAPAPADGATPAAPILGTVTGAYLTIENTSDTDYRLVAIDADFAGMSMLHQSTVDDQGVMRMRMVMGGLDIPAGATVQLAPGGYHAMLMNVTADVYPSEAVPLTLTFADASGATFDRVVGAVATDFPPEDDGLIAANALGILGESGIDVQLVLENRGDQDDAVTAITSGAGGTITLDQNPLLSKIPELPVNIPAHGTFAFSPDDIYIVSDLALAQGEAFPLTLEFASGKTLTVAVPITGAAS